MSLYYKIRLTGVLKGKSEHQEETISKIGMPFPFLISLAFCGLRFPLKQGGISFALLLIPCCKTEQMLITCLLRLRILCSLQGKQPGSLPHP